MQKQNKSKKTWADRRIIVGITTVLHQPKDFPAQCFISALICFNSFFFFNFLPLFLQNMQSILIKQTKKIKIHSNLFFFCTRNAFAFFVTVHKCRIMCPHNSTEGIPKSTEYILMYNTALYYSSCITIM